MAHRYRAPPGATAIGKTRPPWGVWWLSALTFGSYYLVWYLKLNEEIDRAAGVAVRVHTFGLCAPRSRQARWLA